MNPLFLREGHLHEEFFEFLFTTVGSDVIVLDLIATFLGVSPDRIDFMSMLDDNRSSFEFSGRSRIWELVVDIEGYRKYISLEYGNAVGIYERGCDHLKHVYHYYLDRGMIMGAGVDVFAINIMAGESNDDESPVDRKRREATEEVIKMLNSDYVDKIDENDLSFMHIDARDRDFHSLMCFRDGDTGKPLNHMLHWHVVDLSRVPKFTGDVSAMSRKALWLNLFKAQSEEDLDLLYSAGDPIICKAIDKIRKYMADEQFSEYLVKVEKLERAMKADMEKQVRKDEQAEAYAQAEAHVQAIIDSMNDIAKQGGVAETGKVANQDAAAESVCEAQQGGVAETGKVANQDAAAESVCEAQQGGVAETGKVAKQDAAAESVCEAQQDGVAETGKVAK